MPSQPSLKILYQDEWMVAVDKPAGWLVHPASEPQEDDLVAMKVLRDQIGKRVNTIHRIDRPTTGVLLMGVDPEISKALHHAFSAHKMKKTYWAVIHGRTPETEWACTEPIQKEADKPIREAHTTFRLLDTVRHPALTNIDEDRLSLIEATPHSGRFHQIRRHLVHAGFPIVGDYRYGGIERCDQLGNLLETGSRMLLMAKRLEFIHPVTKQSILIEADTEPMFEKCYLG
ncbi:MAG: pseudouridine synthase [Rubritalea sp.]|jgi:tRNA pseudouridine65 synthase|tara:strand:- start:1651 stop:2340 length:690 start_codon:yes stop_codon:yes gene_type:complete